jgi:hypothetical protein
MPHKLENGKYAFKGGCIGEKGTDGKYKLVAMRNNKTKKGKKANNIIKSEIKGFEKKETHNKKRRSKKKTFSSKQISTQTQTQTGGHNSNLDITVHMLREFYSKNI